MALQEAAALLRGVELGPVIGCWCGSLCYRATWQKKHVAVMVRQRQGAKGGGEGT